MLNRPVWLTFAVFAVLLVSSFAIGDTSSFDTPPEFDKGWNMISSPCDISVSDLKQKLGSEELEVQRWNGAGYEATDSLVRGRGYFVNVNAVLNSSAVCDSDEVNESFTMTYAAGWNLLGNPYRTSLSFEELFGSSAGDISDSIYELRGNKFAALTKQDHAKPWRGYWIYANKDITVEFPSTFTLEIEAYNNPDRKDPLDDDITLLKSEKLYLSAVIRYEAEGDAEKTKDVTADAAWSVSDGNIGAISADGVFTPAAEGSVEITAEYLGAKSGPLAVTVSDKTRLKCEKVVIAYTMDYNSSNYSSFCYNTENKDAEQCALYPGYENKLYCWNTRYGKYAFYKGEKTRVKAFCASENNVFISYSNSEFSYSAEISDDVVWKTSDAYVVERIEKNEFRMVTPGDATISADYGTQKSNDLLVSVDERKLRNIYLSIDYNRDSGFKWCENYPCDNYSGYLVKGGTLGLEATGYFGGQCSYWQDEDISGSVTWSVSDASLASIDDKGNLTPLATGIVSVYAEKDGVKSEAFTVRIVEDKEILSLELSPTNNIKVAPGGAASVMVTAYRADVSANCDKYSVSNSNNFCISTSDVTGDAEWIFSNPSVGSIKGGIFTAGKEEGKSDLKAKYQGLESNSITLTVKTINWMTLRVQPDGAGYLPDCPFATCYYAKVGNNVQLRVYGRDEASYWVEEQELTASAAWEVSDPSVATIGEGGVLAPASKGVIWVRATVGDARSDKVWIAIVDDQKSEFLIIGSDDYYSFKPMKPLKAGDSYFFSAIHYSYDPSGGYECDYDYYMGSCRASGRTANSYSDYYDACNYFKDSYVTDSATWNSSDTASGNFESKGVFTGIKQGMVNISATYNTLTSNTVTVDVWDFQNMQLCDPAAANSADWSDEKTRATLETDCAQYKQGEKVHIRYTAEIENSGIWLLDNCLDLYVLDESSNIVKTLREEGCSTEPLNHASARTLEPVYQYLASWDMKDNSGKLVQPGKYFAVARFYIFWEPVIRLPFEIKK